MKKNTFCVNCGKYGHITKECFEPITSYGIILFHRNNDKNEIIKIRADWTNSDPSITRELNKIGRNGVPTYVLYGPNDYHFIFPEILTEKNTINSIRNIINNNG